MPRKITRIESLVGARSICHALGECCRRTLYDMIQRGDFPPPDRPAQKRGERDLWRQSTVAVAIEEYVRTTGRA